MADLERIRLVILGGAGVGKSCIVKRFLFKTYSDKYRATVEDLYNREYDLGSTSNIKVRLKLYFLNKMSKLTLMDKKTNKEKKSISIIFYLPKRHVHLYNKRGRKICFFILFYSHHRNSTYKKSKLFALGKENTFP